jgi:acetyl/propionyl-CoA carboxylase alpha subunit
MLLALDDYIIHGIRTNITYLVKLLQGEAFTSNSISTKFCDEHTGRLTEEIIRDKNEFPSHVPVIGYLMYTLKRNLKTNPGCCDKPNLWETVGYWRNQMSIGVQFEEEEITVNIPGYSESHYIFEIRGDKYHASPFAFSPNRIDFTIGHHNYVAWISEDAENHAFVSTGGHIFRLKRHDILADSVFASGFDSHGHDANHVSSPMPGKVITIRVKEGDLVKKGDTLLIIEAMKMENLIVSPRDAIVKTINVAINDRVESTSILIEFENLEI